MFNAVKNSVSDRHRTPLIVFLLAAAVAVLLPASAQAQCAKTWDASGQWEIRQGRGGKSVLRLDLKQSGSALSGKAFRDGMTGEAVGDADGDYFSIGVTWTLRGEITMYRAKVSASGKLEGETFIGPDKRNRETWYSDQPLTCGWSPGKSRGNLTGRLSADATIRTGQATGSLLKGPILVASQPIYPTPYHPVGYVVLTWDAGPDHPNAAVWAKYNGSRDRVLVMKQPKAGMQVAVQRGQMYNYFLMDGRNVLATATFVAQ